MTRTILPSASNSIPNSSYSQADWQGGYRSLTGEYQYWIDEIQGEIPADLQGTLFRNGPGLLDVNGQRLAHPFDGDGMISAIVFDQGRAYFHNRFVQTEGYEAEQAAGQLLYRGVFGTQKPGGWLKNCFDVKLKNIANTNVIYWGGKLLALWEAAEPHRLDPLTLQTLGLETLDGLLKPGEAFSAHPRIDPGWNSDRQPRLVNFGLKAGLSSTITIHEFDPDLRVLHQRRHTVPGFAFLHDFVITPNYCIFFQNPVRFNPLPFVLGWRGAAQCIDFQPQEPTRILVIPRHGSGAVQIFETEACFVFHHANAFERVGQLVIDSICYEFFPQADPAHDYLNIDFNAYPAGQLCRFTVDLASGGVQRQVLDTRSCEFPTLHPTQVGQAYRYVYLATAHDAHGNAPLQAIAKFDLETGDRQIWSAAPRGFVSEPIFVPRRVRPASSTANPGDLSISDAEAEEGWLLTLVYNAALQRSQLVILAAENLAQGPVATLSLRHHIPYGLHGSFCPEIFGPVA